MRLRTFVAINAALLTTLACAPAEQTYSFLGSNTNSWVVYAGASAVPNLVTTTPGSIVDAAASGSSYGRLTNSFAAYLGS